MPQTVEAIRDWFRSCPVLQKGNRFGVDYLSADPTEYAIYMSPSTISSFVDVTGEVCIRPVQEISFIFASREKHSSDVLQSLANHGFYDAVIAWIIEQNKVKNFPALSDGVVISVLPSLTQYLFEAGANSGRYQISCKLKYRRNPGSLCRSLPPCPQPHQTFSLGPPPRHFAF